MKVKIKPLPVTLTEVLRSEKQKSIYKDYCRLAYKTDKKCMLFPHEHLIRIIL